MSAVYWVMLKELLAVPNLVSISRILLTPIIAYFLTWDSTEGMIICAMLLVIAGITDGLDGYLARRMGKVSDFGIALDPIADKIFAGVLVILLILYREFPIWLAFVIVGRDLLILLGGMILLRGQQIVVPSNHTGKYAFASIATLLGSYVIKFEFGIALFTWLSLVLIAASTLVYFRVFIKVKRGDAPERFKDTSLTKLLRLGTTAVVSVFVLYRLFLYIF